MVKSVKRTAIHSLHLALGAKMIEFGGFEMPLSYSGIIEEHRAVRSAAGLFDLSHMGEFELTGDDVLPTLEHDLTNSAARLAEGQAHYTIMCGEDGGTLDDLIVYRLDSDVYMLCVNAANIDTDREWLLQHRLGGVKFRDISDGTGLIAIQGPFAKTILSRLTLLRLSDLRRFHCTRAEICGFSSIVARTGYTGEDGYEIFVDAESSAKLFAELLDAGKNDGIKPCGLGARDTLRMEAGLALYGHELARDISPLEANLSNFIKFDHDFIGSGALAAQRDRGVRRHLVGIETDDGRSIARQGYELSVAGRRVGVVTSGTFAPSFGRPLAIALVDSAANLAAGAHVEVSIRQRMAPAAVRALPFYHRPSSSA